MAADPNDYTDETLVDTLRATGTPRILTTRRDGAVVYVALNGDGELVEVDPSGGV